MTNIYDIEPGDRTRYVFFVADIPPSQIKMELLGITLDHCIVGLLNLCGRCYTFCRNEVVDPFYYTEKMGMDNPWSDAIMSALITEALGTEVDDKLLHSFCKHLPPERKGEWIIVARTGVAMVRAIRHKSL